MSDKNANDNDAPETGADAPKAQETADSSAESPEAEAGNDEKSGWELGPEAQIEALATEAADLKDKLLRTMAEMENMRRRAERERDEAKKYAVTAFARDMLAVGDNMTRAIQSLGEDARSDANPAIKTLIEGVEMTEREMVNVFERHGITKLDPKGERFDPNFHQAMFEIENPDVSAGTVLEVVATGYVIGERVLRPAMVGVSKGGPKAPKPAAPEEPSADEPAASSEAEAAAEAQAAAKSHQDAANASDEASGNKVDRSA